MRVRDADEEGCLEPAICLGLYRLSGSSSSPHSQHPRRHEGSAPLPPQRGQAGSIQPVFARQFFALQSTSAEMFAAVPVIHTHKRPQAGQGRMSEIAVPVMLRP